METSLVSQLFICPYKLAATPKFSMGAAFWTASRIAYRLRVVHTGQVLSV